MAYKTYLSEFWQNHVFEPLRQYITIPNVSPLFDETWDQAGHMEQALQLALDWLKLHLWTGAEVHVGRLPGKTPLLLVTYAGDGAAQQKNVLIYGHLDKQPEMTGWRPDLGPWKPVFEDGKLYGRGAADDGYALFAAVSALRALREEGHELPRLSLLIEFSEESGSPDLPPYVDHYADRIGEPDLVLCLDSGAGNYDQMWVTTSLRGMISAHVKVAVMEQGAHSGDASGVVPSSFRIFRNLLDRVEDSSTGQILVPQLHAPLPDDVQVQCQTVGKILGDYFYKKFAFIGGTRPVSRDLTELVVNRTWMPTLSYTGQDGMPPASRAGNVLRPYTTFKLSFRLPPVVDAPAVWPAVAERLSQDVPYDAQVTFDHVEASSGWMAPALDPQLGRILHDSSVAAFGKPALFMGEGYSIPFMGMLGHRFPRAQFVITGVLGPQANAHGPNEFLHWSYVQKLTESVTCLLRDWTNAPSV